MPSRRSQRALDEVSALFDRGDDPYLRERKGDVADVVGRLCMNLRADGDPRDLLRDIDGPLVLVADELSPSLDRAARLAAARGVRHRRRQLDVSHRDPRAIAARAGGRRAAPREPADSAGRAARGRRHHRRGLRRSARQTCSASWTRDRRSAAPTSSRSTDSATLPSVTAGRRRRSGSKPTSSCPRSGARARARRRRHRPLSIGVPAGRRRRGRPRRGRAVRRLRAAARSDGAAAASRSAPSTSTEAQLRPRRIGAETARGRRSGCAGCASACRSTRSSRRSCARCCAPPSHGPLRIMFPFVTGVEELRAARAAVAQARDDAAGARHRRARRCRSAS